MFNKNNKIKFIVVISAVTLIFIITGILMFSKLAYSNKDKLNVKKAIKTAKQEKQDNANKALEIKVVGDEKREKKLKEFADEYKGNNNYDKNSINSTPERRTQNGEFYVDNAGDLYSEKLVDIDDMGRIEDRLKDAANDMGKVYSETSSFNNDADKLNAYLSKGDNKSRFSYLYGIGNSNDLKNFVSKLSFLKNNKVEVGILSNIKKVDDNNITFQFQIKTKNATSQSFNVSINFADERAILNMKIS
ncbi:hypothetical protein ACJDT4_13955 [Clostridium neuense]|uniref:Lipoprotein n=1 Tax=Clostridium neuense TaxID=1728934 RepID=A0ABW8TGT6_9CLOT